ncbi:hypothetical protein [Salinibacterium sp. ZJ77]|uniref:hypothetical protein n=1 Tax=Salinibacterium sp. ZJ77 TaxID=2708337 RepID=UPI001423782B|nr:hypothetical protein [Salinibacterium sp. ZJ77]
MASAAPTPLEPLRTRIVATARTTESRALLVAAAAFALAFLTAIIGVRFQSLPISGAWSLGAWTSAVAAIAAAAAFCVGYLLPAPTATRHLRPTMPRWRLTLDISALALAHGFTTLLLLEGLSIIMAQAFLGAVVFPFSSMVVISAATAMAAYTSFLSAAEMTAARVASVFAVFLVVGVFASMLSTSDSAWWQKNISALGATDDIASIVFTITLVVAGAVITALADYLAVELAASGMARSPRDDDERRESVRIRMMRIGLLVLGLSLTLVGVFHVNWVEWVHNTFATALVVVFAALVIALPLLVPRIPAVFVAVGYAFVAVIIGASLFFAFGIYTLTATEIVCFALVITWLIVLIRNISAGTGDAARA